jgi:hypothetical protein
VDPHRPVPTINSICLAGCFCSEFVIVPPIFED